VETEREAKSIGHEETFATDRHDADDLMREAVRLADAVASRLRNAGSAARTVSLKVRFADFTTVTRSRTLPGPICTAQAILEVVEPILHGLDVSPGVRLLGVSVSNFADLAEQLSLDTLFTDAHGAPGPTVPDWVTAATTIDAIRDRFGGSSIGPASTVSGRGLRVVRRGAQQWGPDQEPDR
jgi:DNA polymerase-4